MKFWGRNFRCNIKTLSEVLQEIEVDNAADFIKMDIEGSELQALVGAELTLRTHRPKLAIAVYHKADDLITIPDYLDGLQLGYRFYLDHFSTNAEETILFACTNP